MLQSGGKSRFWKVGWFLLGWLCVSQMARSASGPHLDVEKLVDEALGILVEYLQIDTSNPPGSEVHGARFLARLLQQEGIPYRVVESAAGRGNLYARLRGTGRERPIILLHHIDVVPADARFWSVAPFSGQVRDGYVWGRGALDTKGLGVAHLITFLSLKRSGLPLKRDVILLATADEEMGGRMGVDWLLANHPDWFRGAEFVFTEGGSNLVRDGQLQHVGVEVTRKSPLWVRLTVRSQPGHSAVPRGDAATHRLVRALDKILRYQPPVRLTPDIIRYFKEIARYQPREFREEFSQIEDSVQDPGFVRRLGPYHQSLLRDTVALTVLRGSDKTNVLPAEASAELDCRLLPGTRPEDFLAQMIQLVNDPALEVETLLSFVPSRSSPESRAVEAIRRVTARLEPQATVGPAVIPGFTDAHFFREKGIQAYGFSPFRTTEAEATGVHGHNERISVESFRQGIRYFHEVITELVF